MTQKFAFYWGKVQECSRQAKDATEPGRKSFYEAQARAWTKIAEKIDANERQSGPVSGVTYYQLLMGR